MAGAKSILVASVISIDGGQWDTVDGQPPTGHPRTWGEARVVTPVNLDVSATMQGDPSEGRVTVYLEGGQAGCVIWTSNVHPNLAVGRRYVFFLWGGVVVRRNDRDEPGMVFDAWPIDSRDMVRTPTDGGVPLATLVSRIAASSQRP